MECCIKHPGLDAVKNVLDEYLHRKYVVQLNGLCTVNYQGRAQSSLDRGERVVIKKQDGAFLVHGPDKYQPRNWQPHVDTWTTAIHEENGEHVLQLRAERTNPHEAVELTFEDVSLLYVTQLVDKAELQVRGHEIDIHEAIEDEPRLVEDGFTVIEREKETPAGFIDVFGRDQENRLVVVEVKRHPDYNTVLQLQRYVNEIRDEYAKTVRGILVAPDITEKVLAYLEERDLEFVDVAMEDVISSYESLDQQADLNAFTA